MHNNCLLKAYDVCGYHVRIEQTCASSRTTVRQDSSGRIVQTYCISVSGTLHDARKKVYHVECLNQIWVTSTEDYETASRPLRHHLCEVLVARAEAAKKLGKIK